MLSVWEEKLKMPSFEALEKDLEVDVLIIGGGICGVLCAYELEKRGIDYVLLEDDRICSKTTAFTTAKITSQHGFIYNKIESKYGVECAKLYYEANENAILKYREIAKDIDCDFKNEKSYVYTLSDCNLAKKEYETLKKINFNGSFTKDISLPFKTQGAVFFDGQASFNPLKFISHISKNLNIYEHTTVRELIGTKALCDKATVKAKKIIVTTHFPFINKHGSYFLKMYQHRSYVLCLEGAPLYDGMYVDENKKGLSFRTYGDYLLIGGGGHRTGSKGGNYTELKDFKERYFPDAKIKYHFATQDCITLDGIAYIGNYSVGTPDMYVATGFNKWGMTSSMMAAEILADLVVGKKNKYAHIYSPSRSIIHAQLASNAAHAIGGWLTFWEKRCPHLGCALKWNSAEHTWDCPCHGSRFTKDGELLDGPATGNLKK